VFQFFFREVRQLLEGVIGGPEALDETLVEVDAG